MTKKHFIAIAAGFKARVDIQAKTGTEYLSPDAAAACLYETLNCALMFCDVAESFNPEFDRNRFLAACGLKSPAVWTSTY